MQSLRRAMEILEHLRDADRPCSLAELAQRSSLPPSTVHRILQAFHKSNYVVYDGKAHLYHLGPALIPLGAAAASRINLQDIARPVLGGLVKATGEDAYLVVIVSGYKGFVLEKVEGPNQLKVVETYGAEVDLHCGAIRKSLLAFQPEEFIRCYIEHGLARHTDHTIVDPQELMKSLMEIRACRVAVSYGEYVKDGVGVGAPVFDRNDNVVASIGIIAPFARVSEERIPYFMKTVREHAAELSSLLGNPGRWQERF